MAIATINRLISLFDGAFTALGSHANMADSERLAVLVHRSMSAKTRAYHNAGHVFYMCEGMNPIQVLAGLFHDVVYFQLDGGFPDSTQVWLADIVDQGHGALTLRAELPQDPALAVCLALFDFQAGQELPLYGGMNEFLSAVLAARLLTPYLQPTQVIEIVGCIEATIPFRGTRSDGLSAIDALAQRVARVYLPLLQHLDPAAALEVVNRAVGDAVVLANRDVGGFAKVDPGVFLSSTWLLIDESNAPLASPGVYSLQQYRGALVRMAGFLGSVDSKTIFQNHRDTPAPEELDVLMRAAQRNIAFACDFLDAKIAAIAIIEALALCTGPDVPISMFLGDIRSAYGRPERVEDFLPEAPAAGEHNPALLSVFEKGRSLESTNDLTSSPLTAFMYRYLGHEGVKAALRQAYQMFAGTASPKAFLMSLPVDMVCAISGACSQIAVSRKGALNQLDAELRAHASA